MYIVAIAWLYVLALVSLMQPSVFRGIVTFIGAGLLPLALLLYLMGTPQRRRDQARRAAATSPEDGRRPGVDDAPSVLESATTQALPPAARPDDSQTRSPGGSAGVGR